MLIELFEMIIMKKIVIHLIVLFFITSCNSNREKINSNRLSVKKSDTIGFILDSASAFNKNEIEVLKKNILNKGDELSFNKLVIYYENESNFKELDKYSIIMTDKYNSGDGYSQRFINTVAINNNNIYSDISDFAKINDNVKNEALSYLERGVEINDINCISMLSNIYRNGIGVEKDDIKADKLKKRIKKL